MYNHNKAQQSKNPCAYFLGFTVGYEWLGVSIDILFLITQ